MLVHEVMTPKPLTVRAETHVKDALELLNKHSITMLPVVSEDGTLIGVLSEVDLLVGRVVPDARATLRVHTEEDSEEDPHAAVGSLMTSLAMTANEDTDVAEVTKLMTTTGVKRTCPTTGPSSSATNDSASAQAGRKASTRPASPGCPNARS